jgi:hypothetical protein
MNRMDNRRCPTGGATQLDAAESGLFLLTGPHIECAIRADRFEDSTNTLQICISTFTDIELKL